MRLVKNRSNRERLFSLPTLIDYDDLPGIKLSSLLPTDLCLEEEAEHNEHDAGCGSHPLGIKWSSLLLEYLCLEEMEGRGISGCVIFHLGLGKSLLSVYSVFLYQTCVKVHLLQSTCT